jgi:hypothetical protein
LADSNSLSPEARRLVALWRRANKGSTVIRGKLSEDSTVPDFPGTSLEADRKRIERSPEYKNTFVDKSGPWSFADVKAEVDDPLAANHILDVLATVIEESEGSIKRVTNLEAEWVARIRLAFPDMPASEVWMHTQRCIRLGKPYYAAFEPQLAFRTWESEGNRERYHKAIFSRSSVDPELKAMVEERFARRRKEDSDG